MRAVVLRLVLACAAPALALLSPLAAQTAPAPATAAALDHVEPPSWWVGMQHRTLQLMLHGERIGDTLPVLQHPGVTLLSVTRVPSPNYLFVTLDIAPDAAPGTLDLQLRRGERTVARHAYALQARAPRSALRQGFGPEDAILNLVPDRFANGDPANDTLPGYPDPLNRADDAAGRHGGDIAGIAGKLDYIAGMGYTQIWPTPLLENNQPRYSYHGYAATDLYRIDPRLGSNEGYRALVQAARTRGVGVIQDIVLNHIGSGHWWMRDLPTPDWITNGGRFVGTEHHRTAVMDPYASQADRDNFTQGWFGPHMPDLNQRNPLLATYLMQQSVWWVEYAGLSGIRTDTYGYSDTAFLGEWSRHVMAEYPNLTIVGEEWSGNPLVVAHWLRGRAPGAHDDGFTSATPSMMDFPLHEALRRALVDDEQMFRGFRDLYAALVNDRLYPEPERMVLFEGNHDVPRLFSVLKEDLALWKMAVVYVATMPRTPQFYYGTELLMTSPTQRDDGATRRDFPGGWPGDAVDAVSGRGLSAQQKEAQAFLRRLLTWRKGQPLLHHGRLTHYAPEHGSYVWFRHEGGGASRKAVMVALNKSTEPVTLDAARFSEVMAGKTTGTDVFTGARMDLRGRFTLPARSATVLELQ